MANFRRNHIKSKKSSQFSVLFKVVLLFAILIGLIFFIINYNKSGLKVDSSNLYNQEDITGIDYIKPKDRLYLPGNTKGQVVHHKYYSLSYNEKYEIAEWVAYVLTKKNLKMPNVKRAKRFEKDPKVRTGSAVYYDYSSSGYSRGHLAPAADMAFNKDAMQESFFLSNITPQLQKFNGGIWNELEQNVRNWAWNNNKIFIVTGPVINDKIEKFIGKNKVGVPHYFYKAIIDIDDPERKSIAFLIPNKMSTKPLSDYVITVDSLENLTGIDFFKDLLSDSEEEKIESNANISKWKLDDKLYQKRLSVWNRR